MADTSIKIGFTLSKDAENALTSFIAKSDAGDKSIKKLGDSGTNTFKEIGIQIGKASGVFDIFAGNLAANVAVKAIEAITGAAKALFDTFVVDGIAAAAAQEQAINDLNVALASTGIYSEETSREMQRLAEEIQATTGVEDDLVLTNATLIQSLGQLDKDGLKRATTAAVDLSAALGKDLGAASEAIGKAAAGNTTAIQKMGIQFNKGQSDAETFSNVLKALEDRFGGTAAQKVNTFSGAVKLVSATFGDLQEEVGGFITQNTVVVGVMKALGQAINEASGNLKAQGSGWKELVGGGILLAIQATNVLITTLDTFGRIGDFALSFVLTGVNRLTSRFATLTDAIGITNGQAEKFYNSAVKHAENYTSILTSQNTTLGGVSTVLFEMEQAAKKGFESINTGASTAIVPLNETAAIIVGLTEAQKGYNQELLSWANNLASVTESNKTQYALDLENLRLQREQQLITETEYNAKRIILEEEQTQADIKRLQGALDQKLISETTYSNAVRSLKLKESTDIKKVQIDQEKFDKEINKGKLTAARDTFGNLSALMQTSNREQFEIGKAAAMAQAAVNIAMAISNAMAGPPTGPIFPFNIALAVSQGIAGAVQLSNIASSQPPRFANGGIVPGSSIMGDQMNARVNSGEMILNRSQQAQLFSMANGGGIGGDQEIKSLLRALVGRDERVIVNVGGKTIVDTVRSELAMGRSFA